MYITLSPRESIIYGAVIKKHFPFSHVKSLAIHGYFLVRGRHWNTWVGVNIYDLYIVGCFWGGNTSQGCHYVGRLFHHCSHIYILQWSLCVVKHTWAPSDQWVCTDQSKRSGMGVQTNWNFRQTTWNFMVVYTLLKKHVFAVLKCQKNGPSDQSEMTQDQSWPQGAHVCCKVPYTLQK